MRIIAGEWRGRILRAPDGDTTRPTADRTRETLFSMLMSRLGSFDGLSVADLFAGSGALGLEALSRGAQSALFIEQDSAAIRAIRTNIAALKAQDRSEVRASSVLSQGAIKQPFDMIFLDPPYGTSAGAVALDKLARIGWIGEGTWVSLETGAGEVPQTRAFDIESERTVGKARITLLRLKPTA